jgi:hypothetical protein
MWVLNSFRSPRFPALAASQRIMSVWVSPQARVKGNSVSSTPGTFMEGWKGPPVIDKSVSFSGRLTGTSRITGNANLRVRIP